MSTKLTPILILLLLGLLVGCCAGRQQTGPRYGYEEGLAVYISDVYHGRKTASGERYDKMELTAAHRFLPFGTVVKVTRTTGDWPPVQVRINDRGPFDDRRKIIDVSRAAAQQLHMEQAGLVPVRLDVVSVPGGGSAPPLPADAVADGS